MATSSSSSYQQGPILLIGGTGTVGSSLVPLLDAQSIPYIIACRSGGSTAAPASSSSSASEPAFDNSSINKDKTTTTKTVIPNSVHFDWMDRSTWEAALTTPSSATSSSPITTVFLVAPEVPHSSTIMNDFVDLARGPPYGVKRFVLLAATAIEAGGPFFGGTMGYLAELGRKGEIEFAILRPTWFQSKFVTDSSFLWKF